MVFNTFIVCRHQFRNLFFRFDPQKSHIFSIFIYLFKVIVLLVFYYLYCITLSAYGCVGQVHYDNDSSIYHQCMSTMFTGSSDHERLIGERICSTLASSMCLVILVLSSLPL